jgi:hypothetical protein
MMVANLYEKDVKEFNKWFLQHPYTIGIDKIMKFVEQRRTRTNGKNIQRNNDVN